MHIGSVCMSLSSFLFFSNSGFRCRSFRPFVFSHTAYQQILFFPQEALLLDLFLFPIQGNPEIDVPFLSVVRATHDINFEARHSLLWL